MNSDRIYTATNILRLAIFMQMLTLLHSIFYFLFYDHKTRKMFCGYRLQKCRQRSLNKSLFHLSSYTKPIPENATCRIAGDVVAK